MTTKTIAKADGALFNAQDLRHIFQSINLIMNRSTLDMNAPKTIKATEEPKSQNGLCYTWSSKDQSISAQLIHTVPASKHIQVASNDESIIEKVETTFGHKTYKVT